MSEDKKVKEAKAPENKQGNATVKAAVSAKKEKPVTYTVKSEFRNAETKVMQAPGDEITVTNPNRFKNLVKKGLIEATEDEAPAEDTGTETPAA